jgi:hypothetical protein
MLGLTGTGAFVLNTKESLRKTATKSSLTTDDEATQSDRFRRLIEKNKYLVSVETEESKTKVTKGKAAKKIISYTANRDTLFIPHPEKPKRPVDIRHNLIEEEKKKPMADIGMQCDKINYVDKEKPFIPQKIGKDVGVQIEDGDLFDFDRDVESILQVLCGKILEQTELELMEEAELKNIRETKENLIKKFKAQKEEIRGLELEEIENKKAKDNLVKIKRLEKLNKVDTQQKLVSRVFAKSFLKDFIPNTKEDLKIRGFFKNYSQASIIDHFHFFVLEQSEVQIESKSQVEKSLSQLFTQLEERQKSHHNKTVSTHREHVSKMKAETQKRREIEAEKKRIEEEERQERRRLRQIRKLREAIKKNIFENPQMKSDYLNEEIVEIDNYGVKGPFSNFF